jgi:hypothetical protein
MLSKLYKEAEAIKFFGGSAHKKGILIEEWFNKAILVETDECIVWPFAKIKGYGNIRGPIKLTHCKAANLRIGICPIGFDTAHGPCHNRACFNYRHLIYKTRSENNRDKVRDKTDARGENSSSAKLSDKEIANIRIVCRVSTLPRYELARLYGISASHLSEILNGNERKFG